MALRIITTEDGSHSLLDEQLNETYHSTRGARGESEHVFIKYGLDYFVQQHRPKQVNVLEIGMGTGLNVFLTALYAKQHQVPIFCTTLEPYPIEKSIYSQLNYAQAEREQALFQLIHSCEWDETAEISNFFQLRKLKIRLEDYSTPDIFQLIYYDAFAPSKQAEVWSLENLAKCYGLLDNGGVLTTYCAQGQFKRNLLAAGFEVETLTGAMGKKEMVRAVKP